MCRAASCSVRLTKYHTGNEIKKTEIGRTRSTCGERGSYKVLVGKPDGKRPLLRPRLRWEDNIKMDLREVGWGAWTGWIRLRNRWRALVNAVMNLRVP